ncbi:MAG: CsgG/HfaB family protein [Treponema sp.]|jgi:hypothetical protein|nr:CsgG/HfaB family protein [Treponema sp.]
MKKGKLFWVLGSFLFTFVSCVSLQDKTLPAIEKDITEMIGYVTTEFTSFQWLHIQNKNGIKSKAYDKLLEEAKKQYGNNVNIRNIKISGSFSGFEVLNLVAAAGVGIPLGFVIGDGLYFAGIGEAYSLTTIGGGALAGTVIGIGLSGNTQKITATGNVVRVATANVGGVEGALARAAAEVSKNFNAKSGIAIVYITAENRSQTDFIAGELEHILQRQNFVIIDRSELERIRAEQKLGTSFEIDDSTAARIGHIAGASVVITGRVDGEGNLRRLRLRALDTTTGQVVGTASERL